MKPGCKRCAKKGSGCWQHPDTPPEIAKSASPPKAAKRKKTGGYNKGDKVTYDPERHCGHPKTDENGKPAGPCLLAKGWGTKHLRIGKCRKHGGTSPSHRISAQRIMAERAVAVYGLPVSIDPQEALLKELERTYGHVLWLGEFISLHQADDLVFGPNSEKSVKVKRPGGEWELHGVRQLEARAAPTVWLKQYMTERRHLVDVASRCVTAGIMERYTKLAESYGRGLAAAIQALIDGFVKAGMIKADDKRILPIARAAIEMLPKQTIDI